MQSIISEIAQTIDSGEVVWFHKTTHEILSYPDPAQAGDEFDYLVQEVMDVVDLDPDSYIQFDPPSSRESFLIMEAFVATLKDDRLKALLMSNLNSRKPFRSFRNAVETEGIVDDWYDFRDAYLCMMVRDKVEASAQ